MEKKDGRKSIVEELFSSVFFGFACIYWREGKKTFTGQRCKGSCKRAIKILSIKINRINRSLKTCKLKPKLESAAATDPLCTGGGHRSVTRTLGVL